MICNKIITSFIQIEMQFLPKPFIILAPYKVSFDILTCWGRLLTNIRPLQVHRGKQEVVCFTCSNWSWFLAPTPAMFLKIFNYSWVQEPPVPSHWEYELRQTAGRRREGCCCVFCCRIWIKRRASRSPQLQYRLELSSLCVVSDRISSKEVSEGRSGDIYKSSRSKLWFTWDC